MMTLFNRGIGFFFTESQYFFFNLIVLDTCGGARGRVGKGVEARARARVVKVRDCWLGALLREEKEYRRHQSQTWGLMLPLPPID